MGSLYRSLTCGLIFTLLMCLVPELAASQAFVQANSNTQRTATTSISVAFTAAQTAGNLNVVVIGWSDTSSTVQSVKDSDGNPYVLAVGTNDTTGVSQNVWYAKNIKGDTGSPVNTVTVTFNQIPSDEDVRILEYSGLDQSDPLDTNAGGFGTGTSAASASATTNSANDLLIGAGTSTSVAGFSAPGSGFTQRSFPGGYGDIVEDQNVIATSTYTATATLGSSGNWVMQIVAFRAAGQTPPVFAAPTITSLNGTTAGDTGGDPITLTGTNFQPGATVVFDNGTVSASLINCVAAPSTTINCTTPAFPVGPVDITVTNVDGQHFTLTGQFTIAPGNPQISKVLPNTGVTNGGTAVTITGSDFAAGATVTVGSVPADNVTVVNLTTIKCNVPANTAGTADVVVINPDGRATPVPVPFTYTKPAGIAFVQANGVPSSTDVSTVNVAYNLAQTPGDLNVVVIAWGDTSASVLSVIDKAGNTYVPAMPPVTVPGVLSQTIYYAKDIRTSVSNSVTVTFSATAKTPDIRVLEYSGIDGVNAIDGTAVAENSGSGLTADSGSLTTTSPADLVIAAVVPATGVSTGGSGFITVNLTSAGDYVEHALVAPAGTVDAQANLSTSGAWAIQAVAFKAGTAPPPPQTFALSASPTSASKSAGNSATYTLSVTPQNGFSAAVNLSCSGPAGVGITCSVSPKSVTPSGSAAQAMLTVNTTAPTAALLAPRHNRNLLPLFALWLPLPGIALAGVGFGSRRRKLGIGLACFLLLALTLLLAGCGGGGSTTPPPPPPSGGTPAGTYNITVTASSAGQTNQTSTVTLTVQ